MDCPQTTGESVSIYTKIGTFLAVPVAGLLATSAYQHIDNSFRFLSTIYSCDLVGLNGGLVAAAYLPFLQLMIALVLLFEQKCRRTAFGFSALLFLVYTIVQSSALYRGLNISCGCFGSSDENPIGAGSISLAAGAMVASVVGWVSYRPNHKSSEATP